MRRLSGNAAGLKGGAAEQPRGAYIKAIPLRAYEDVDVIKSEVKSGNIVITNVTPLAKQSIEDVKRAINELYEYAGLINGDIARLGEERIVLAPSWVRIWRDQKGQENNR